MARAASIAIFVLASLPALAAAPGDLSSIDSRMAELNDIANAGLESIFEPYASVQATYAGAADIRSEKPVEGSLKYRANTDNTIAQACTTLKSDFADLEKRAFDGGATMRVAAQSYAKPDDIGKVPFDTVATHKMVKTFDGEVANVITAANNVASKLKALKTIGEEPETTDQLVERLKKNVDQYGADVQHLVDGMAAAQSHRVRFVALYNTVAGELNAAATVTGFDQAAIERRKQQLLQVGFPADELIGNAPQLISTAMADVPVLKEVIERGGKEAKEARAKSDKECGFLVEAGGWRALLTKAQEQVSTLQKEVILMCDAARDRSGRLREIETKNAEIFSLASSKLAEAQAARDGDAEKIAQEGIDFAKKNDADVLKPQRDALEDSMKQCSEDGTELAKAASALAAEIKM